uniref:Uncharacterized protein n=1 Tax=Solanum tuberosum TaxID=4113 RepID=M1ARV9_SOLTU
MCISPMHSRSDFRKRLTISSINLKYHVKDTFIQISTLDFKRLSLTMNSKIKDEIPPKCKPKS